MPTSNHYVGLDVSLKETSICVIDDADAVIWRGRTASTGEAIGAAAQQQQKDEPAFRNRTHRHRNHAGDGQAPQAYAPQRPCRGQCEEGAAQNRRNCQCASSSLNNTPSSFFPP